MSISEKCLSCGCTLGPAERAYLWKDSVTCENCYHQLAGMPSVVAPPKGAAACVCANCEQPIGKLEKAEMWESRQVCWSCWNKLSAQADVARANAKSSKVRWKQRVILYAVILGILVAILALGHEATSVRHWLIELDSWLLPLVGWLILPILAVVLITRIVLHTIRNHPRG